MIDKIKLGPIEYEVIELGCLEDHNNNPIYGAVDMGLCRMVLESFANHQWKAVSLLHEVVHVMLDQAGQEHDEKTINVLAHGIYGLIKYNPELVDWIGGDDQTAP